MSKFAYVLLGVSGSGKSTATAELREAARFANVSFGVLSFDEIRLRIYEEATGNKDYEGAFQYSLDNRKDFLHEVDNTWKEILKCDVVVVDNTNQTPKSRARWIADLHAKKFHVTGVHLMCSLETLIARQRTRGDKRVPASSVRQQFFNISGFQIGEVDDIVTRITE